MNAESVVASASPAWASGTTRARFSTMFESIATTPTRTGVRVS